jgi:S-formylglutathione hydrolase FrmB
MAGVLLMVALLFGSSVAQAQCASPSNRPRVVDTLLHVRALERNAQGDSPNQQVVVYLPPSYNDGTQKRYPTLYLLHGIGGSPDDWGPDGFQGMDVGLVSDSLIRAGAVEEMIIVTPNGKNRYLGAFYLNSATNGGWEDYIVRELVQHVDRTYRTRAAVGSRGLAGHSMGGFGALMLGMRHPDVFGAVYALSPCCLGMVADLSPTDSAWYRLAEYKNWDDLLSRAGQSNDFMPIGYVALAASISPNPAARPWRADLPVVVRHGRLTRQLSAFRKWQETFPLAHVRKSQKALRRLRGMTIDVGVNDEFTHITAGTVLFSDSLAAYDVPHALEIYDGDHRDRIRERITTRVLPFFSRELVFDVRR